MKQSKFLLNTIQLFEQLELKYALIGGVAISLRTRERFTKDIDFAIAVNSDDEVEKIALILQKKGYYLEQVLEQTAKNRISTLRFSSPNAKQIEPNLDLLFASSGIEHEIVKEAERIELLPEISIPVARNYHLIALKVLSDNDSRPNDKVDLHALITTAKLHELKRVKKILQLIEERGFNREKNLTKAYATILKNEGIK